jgi:phosphoribosylamine--glycine ligase
MSKIAFAGTDGRTYWGALTAHFNGHEGVIVRGMPGMEQYVKEMGYPLQFIKTRGTKAADYTKAIIQAFKNKDIDYLIPMPEALQFEGMVDEMIAAGYGNYTAGFTKKGAFVEGDKIACKELCQETDIKTAFWKIANLRKFQEFSDICRRFLQDFGGAVSKYPYSAGGKGARIINSDWDIPVVYDGLIKDYAKEYSERFGKNGEWPILIEEKRAGTEVSFLILIDKKGNYCVLPTTMDFPERFDAPSGPLPI